MAWEQCLYHSQLSDGLTVEWARLAENVGRGVAATSIHESFATFPPHYANLTDALTHIGAGAVHTSHGILYDTEVFLEAGRPSGPSPTPPAPRTRTPTPHVTNRSTEPAGLPAVRPFADPARPLRWPADESPAGQPLPSPRLIHILRQLRELQG